MFVNKHYLASVECCFFVIVSSKSLASQGLEKNCLCNNVLPIGHTVAIVYTIVAPWEVLQEGTSNGYHSLLDINVAPPRGCYWLVQRRQALLPKETSMAGL
jgi:hypothetical protein